MIYDYLFEKGFMDYRKPCDSSIYTPYVVYELEYFHPALDVYKKNDPRQLKFPSDQVKFSFDRDF